MKVSHTVPAYEHSTACSSMKLHRHIGGDGFEDRMAGTTHVSALRCFAGGVISFEHVGMATEFKQPEARHDQLVGLRSVAGKEKSVSDATPMCATLSQTIHDLDADMF